MFPVSFVFPVSLVSSYVLFFVSRVPLFRLKNMKYSVALPLFLIWRENLGVPLLHVTTCGVFLHAQDVKECDFL